MRKSMTFVLVPVCLTAVLGTATDAGAAGPRFGEGPTDKERAAVSVPGYAVLAAAGENGDAALVPDPGLRKALLEAVQKNGGKTLTAKSLAGIQKINQTENLEIRDLTGIEYAKNLTELELRGNQIADLAPLRKLSQLKRLGLADNEVTDLSPLAVMAKLQYVNVQNNRITHIGHVQQLKKLVSFNAGGNEIADITKLKGLKKLKELDLHQNRIRDVEPLRELDRLQQLNLGSNEIADIVPLEQLTRLKDVVLSDNRIADVTALSGLKQVTVRLHLSGNDAQLDYAPIAPYYENIKDVDFSLSGSPAQETDNLPLAGTERSVYLLDELKKHNTYMNDPKVIAVKYEKMAASPSEFYRGTAHLFFKDAARNVLYVPQQWKTAKGTTTWITGDLHTENVGFYGDRSGQVIFDLNDFDEAAAAPFYYDLLRFSTSLALLNDAAPGLQLSEADMKAIIKSYAEAYRAGLKEVAAGNVDLNAPAFTAATLTGFTGKAAKKAGSRDRIEELNKWTLAGSGKRIFDLSNKKLEQSAEGEKQEITANWDTYLHSLDAGVIREKGEAYFQIKDIARRVDAGLGSYGRDRFYVLIEGSTSSQDDDIILDVKAQDFSVVEKAWVASGFETAVRHADRSLAGMKAMHPNPDLHWGTLYGQDVSYLVKERSPFKEEFKAKDFKSRIDLENFTAYSAKAAAYAHTRGAKKLGHADFAADVSDMLEHEWTDFGEKLAEAAFAYRAQTVSDQQAFRQLLSEGAFNPERLQAVQ